MSSKGHRPQRTCLGCGARESQDRLIRLAVTDQGRLIVDKSQGRGGYLHKNPECWRMFLGRKGQYRAFHIEIARATKEQLINELKGR
ncbi:MAG: YlxR family protein [Candidatus Binatia bacterium]